MNRRKQLIVLYALPLVAVIFSLVTHANTLTSLLLFWGIPSVLLTAWAWERVPKVALFALIGTVFLVSLNIIFYVTNQWYVISMSDYRLFGFMAWEDIPYFFLWVYFPIIFWEHFYERQIHERLWTKRMTSLACVFFLTSLAILTAWTWMPDLLQIPYFYFVGTVLLIIIPLALEVLFHPRMGLKFVRVALYFAYIGIMYELTALKLGQWIFPSDKFIGWIEIVGLRFPIEELFAWILLGSTAILSWYEYFDDDNR